MPSRARRLLRNACLRLFTILAVVLLAGVACATMVRLAPGFGVDERELDPHLRAESIAAIRAQHAPSELHARMLVRYTHGPIYEEEFRMSDVEGVSNFSYRIRGVNGHEITDPAACRATFPFFADARIAAGGPLADNVMQCQLKPLDQRDYRVSFTAGQWARLKQAFPTGVCDYRRLGVGQGPSVSWLTFAGGPGGRPLGPAPRSTPDDEG